jgi:hypothetical protein
MDIQLVGGGGGGSRGSDDGEPISAGGGGGGYQHVTNVSITTLTITNITVGAGGNGGTVSSPSNSRSGEDSTLVYNGVDYYAQGGGRAVGLGAGEGGSAYPVETTGGNGSRSDNADGAGGTAGYINSDKFGYGGTGGDFNSSPSYPNGLPGNGGIIIITFHN